jgi:metallo-beta-lactamase family protein
MNITFHGAAREVTGSCYLIETATTRFLVDCGMFQGGREASARNRLPFGFDPCALDFVLLTHAHIDHSGLLPKLTRAGYTGPIYATGATVDLLAVMLPDSAHIQEAEAERASRRIQSAKPGKLSPSDAVPAYTMQDAVDCLQQLHPVAYDTDVVPHADVRCRFRDAGHILGSAILEIWVREGETTTKLVMSGDLGQPGRPILRDPTVIEEADVLFIESTYGDRAHKDQVATMEELVQVLEHTLPHGNVIVPAFAVGRTQEVLYHLHRLTSEGRLRNLNIYVDSPMAAAATRITMKYLALFDEAARSLEHWRAAGKNLPSLRFTASVEESMALNRIRAGAIVISASGMCNAGRIKHHLRHNLGRRECSVLITGFQAQGTLGRKLVDGAKQVSIFGEEIPVRAAIHTLGGFSAHAGQPALLAWAAGFKRPPRQTFVVHGEESAALAFAERLRSDRGWAVTVPAPGQSVSM